MSCRRRRRLYVYISLTCLASVCVYLVLLSKLPPPSDGGDEHYTPVETQRGEAPAHTVVLNGKRDILNVEQREQAAVPSVAAVGLEAEEQEEQQQQEVKQEVDKPHPQTSPQPTVSEEEEVVVHVPDDVMCSGPWPGYPSCATKIEWMKNNWKIDACYAKNGVDGSMCSFQHYLSVVEKWCPPLPHSFKEARKKQAAIQPSLQPLLDRMSGNPKLSWISRRIQSRWTNWVTAAKLLEMNKPFRHSQKTLLIHIGALTDKAGFKFAENADHGGPLGELVQWSDLIASLHLLGHKLDFSTEIKQLSNFLQISTGHGGCPTSSETRYNAVYIDIVGLKQFKKLVKNRIQHYKCLFRVLDSFGTEPQFNFKPWKPTRREYGRIWGNWELQPRQFMTMYPHTPDNSFLGFVVGSNRTNAQPPYPKKNIGLVYGKELYMWKDKRSYLDLISRHVDIHATIGTTEQKHQDFDTSIIPGFVTNHGILNSTSLELLLQETKLFIGMGFPYEGPAPLEAIAKGCYFLNPVVDPPLNRDNSKFFKGKPTLRSLDSQNPYTAEFIGRPYVYTLDMSDTHQITAALKEITSRETPPPYLPYEFTYEGMLERVAIYLENQEFCVPRQWPPSSELVTVVGGEGESCKDSCHRQGMVCEPEFFPLLNTKESLLSNGLTCSYTRVEHSVHGPSHTGRTCSLQESPLLLSCAGAQGGVQRLCPCRTFRRGQVALCESCTR